MTLASSVRRPGRGGCSVERTLTASSTRTSGWIGAELSPPAGPPMWLCESTIPGMTVLPARSTVVAPAGIDTCPLAPTATIFPS